MVVSIQRLAPLLAVLLLAACGEDPGPTGVYPEFAISDGAHQGNGHFYFLPPMVESPEGFAAAFDGSQAPLVRICEWGPAGCVGGPVAEFRTTTGSGSEMVRAVPEEEHYVVNWHLDEFELLPTPASYRIMVLVGNTELGYADVQIGSTGRDVRNLTTNHTIGLMDGRTLPIKFRIEGFPVGAGGATVVALGGDAVLVVGGGAIQGDVSVTVFPTTASPAIGLIEGSIFDCGPEGIVFDPPASLTLRYDEAALGNVPESSLTLLTEVEGGWEEAFGSSVDQVSNAVTGLIHGFSRKATGEKVEKVVYTEEVKEPLKPGETKELKAETKSASGKVLEQRKIRYTSSDEAVAVVDETGKVTAKQPGKAVITAESDGKTVTTEVSVGPDLIVSSVGSVSISGSTVSVGVTLSNIGTDAAEYPGHSTWDVAVYVSTDPVLDGADTHLTSMYSSWAYYLSAGWSASVTLNGVSADPTSLIGKYLIVVADAFPGQPPNYYPGVVESDEGNNWAASEQITGAEAPPSGP